MWELGAAAGAGLAAGMVGMRLLAGRSRRKGPALSESALAAACERMSETGGDDDSLAQAVASAARLVGAEAAGLYLTEGEGILFICAATWTSRDSVAFPRLVTMGQGLIGHAVELGQEIRASRNGEDPGALIELDSRTQAVVVLPLSTAHHPAGGTQRVNRVVGALVLSHFSDVKALAGAGLEPARAAASVLAMAIGYRMLEQFQQETLVQAMQAVSHHLEEKDPYVAGHSHRAGALALLIGRRLQLDRTSLDHLRLGMALHDIGKVAVSDEILHKTTKLTDEEFRQIARHTEVGFEICRPLRLPPEVLSIIRSHHERLDGSGYPDGLRADEMPLILRIAGVSIAYDAMKSKRPWRPALTAAETLTELAKVAGRHVDPTVVQALQSVVTEGDYFDIYPEDRPERLGAA
ncbi:MAG: HD domain-containing protein [Fimbriimonadaceae bacterium]|nr:HD domain-containing protein [Fimbriimonadaceae bacterium]